jgi:hypothetical protein
LVYNELSQGDTFLNGYVSFVTDPGITKEASRMLYLADAVIGTGRSFMEAASLGKPLLTINAADDYPVLINQDNFSDAFKTNFSQRNVFKSFNANTNLENIIKMINDYEYYLQLSCFSKNMFENYFTIKKAMKAYVDVYKQSTKGNNRTFSDYKLVIKSYFNFYRSAKKIK